jgi:hypothetical protein
MTTLNTIIEEEKHHKNVDLLKRYIQEAYPQGKELISLVDVLLATSMQRAYEAGAEAERERTLLVIDDYYIDGEWQLNQVLTRITKALTPEKHTDQSESE